MLTLNNDLKIPDIGLGASIVPSRLGGCSSRVRAQKKIYQNALSMGCRMFDISSAYGQSEKLLGQALKKSGVARGDAFLMVKISNTEQRTMPVDKALDLALSKLDTDYIDLLLLHWPQTETYVDAWKQMTKLYKDGRVRAIGVSNFHPHHLEAIAEVSDIVPAVNQIEVHPLFTQKPLIQYCSEREIQVVAYSPLGRMHDVLIKSKILRKLGEKYRKSVVQIILRWDLQLGLIPIPRTCNPVHLSEFLDVYDFTLTDEEIAAINALNENIRLRYNPDTCDFSIL